VKGLLPVAMLLIGRGRPREHPNDTSDHVISSSRGSPTYDVRWRYIRWKVPTRADIAQLPVAHARTLPRGFRSRHFRHFR